MIVRGAISTNENVDGNAIRANFRIDACQVSRKDGGRGVKRDVQLVRVAFQPVKWYPLQELVVLCTHSRPEHVTV